MRILWLLTVIATSMQGATYNAATCNLSDVLAAITAELATPADGDIISIPMGTCTWTGTTAVTAAFTTSVTIRGAGATSATNGGTTTTGSDLTTIIDNFSNNGHSILILSTAAAKVVRFTGIALLTNASSVATNNGVLEVVGQSAVRIDHCHFYIALAASILGFTGGMTGVVDHNYFNSPANLLTTDMNVKNGMNWNGDAFGQGDQSWVDTDHWGSGLFLFIEDNQFYDGDPADANSGAARYVFRYNTVITSGVSYAGGQFFNHGLSPSRGRSTRAAEVYFNTFTRPGPTGGGNPPYSLNGGTLLYWSNTITQYREGVQLDYTRKDSSTYNYGSTPTGWGYCNPPSPFTSWDGPTSGYPCLDAAGHGAGDLLTGNFPSIVNNRTGTIAWPVQALSPIYVWNNTYTPSGGYSGTILVGSVAQIADNRDYYQQFGPLAEPGSFNGTTGVGQGLLSARTSTCTSGPGGNTPGVGYWATDTNTLYVCNPTNTWTTYYTPYTYPHPLQGGASSPTVTTTCPLTQGYVGASYNTTGSGLLTNSGGTAPFTWSISAGGLPSGLSISGNSIIGTPTTAGSSSFTLLVTDSASMTGSQACSLTVNPPAPSSPVSTAGNAIAAGTSVR